MTATELEPATTAAPQPKLTELVSGILSDAQTLFRQQVEMVRAEVKEDMRRSKDAAKFLGLGAVLLTVGALFLMVGLVYLLAWAAPQLPMFACWLIVGGTVFVLGGIAAYAGTRVLKTFNPLPDKSFNALSENMSWTTKNPQS